MTDIRFRFHFRLIILLSLIFYTLACNDPSNPTDNEKPLFTLLSASETGIDFANKLEEDVHTDHNILSYEYFFNGAGVAIGDLNNDGLQDLFLTGNQTPNKLYLNKGNMEFEDISETAGINKGKKWATGVTLADVNGDGWQDIYVCQAGPEKNPKNRQNLLFINNRNLTFSERATAMGLNDNNRSTHAAFFDYDKDGDLDCYVINEAKYFRVVLAAVFNDLKDKKNLEAASSNLFRNDGGKFVKVTEQAGMLRYGYGLGLSVSDINDDGWPDLYIANDYSVPDFMYINNGDGTFTDKIKEMTRQISFSGMGSDIADINNDGLPDIAVVDMAPDDHVRSKTLMASMDVEGFRYFVNDLGYQVQYMFNSLQLNNGNGTFSNIANISGVAKTDWSWTVLLADYDNDGYKDCFVTNGYRRNAMDNDFRRLMAKKREAYGGSIPQNPKLREELYALMPQIELGNLAYRNNHDLTFTDLSKEWGLDQLSYSNGAAYGDLDNDGDLDLVVNNIEQPAFVYRNNASELKKGNFLRVQLKGETPATPTVCAKVRIHYGDKVQMGESVATRGYVSAVEEIVHFGLGKVEKVDILEVEWPDGRYSRLENVAVNQILTLDQKDATDKKVNIKPATPPPLQKLNPGDLGITFRHTENPYDDFAKEILLPHKQSALGPRISVADANNDGLEDFFVGGAATQTAALYFQNPDGTFQLSENPHFQLDINSEDMDALFFDGNGNGTQDLYVVSGGGGEFVQNPGFLQDRLYANDGNGQFLKTKGALPEMPQSGTVARSADFDRDGDMDIFVGGAAIPGKYPYPSRSLLLRNDFGQGKITDVTAEFAPELMEVGIVKDALWTDLNNDQFPDLILVGEWMPVKVFMNENGQFHDASAEYGTDKLKGWWYSLAAADVDNDGDEDFIVGNVGLNTKFHATEKKPFNVFADDFDGNGTCDIVLSKEYKGKLVPTRGRQCSSEQMPFIEDKFPTYLEFANAGITDILGKQGVNNSLHLQATSFQSVVLINTGNSFKINPLPNEAQIAPINAIIAHDLDSDGNTDLIVAGNNYDTEVETPRYDAGSGLVLKGNGDGTFTPLSVPESGFFAPGNVKDLALLNRATGGKLILVANNDGPVEVFEIREGGLLSLK